MTPEQCRNARRLLGLTQGELSQRCHVPVPSLSLFERAGHFSPARVNQVRSVLEAAGAEFTDDTVAVRLAPIELLSGEQCREARRLLGWSQQQLTLASHVAISQVSSFEARGGRLSRRDLVRARKLRTALEAAGVEFITENGGGAEVRLKGGAPPCPPDC